MSSFDLEPLSVKNDPGISQDPAPEFHTHALFSQEILLTPLTPWSNTYATVPSRLRVAGDFCSIIAFVNSGAAIIEDFPNIFQLPTGLYPKYNTLSYGSIPYEVNASTGIVRYKPFNFITLAPSGNVVLDKLIWRIV